MKTYTIILTVSIEAETKQEALDKFVKENIDFWNTGENIEIEEETEERSCRKCGKTSGLLKEEDICYTCAKERGII